VLSDELERCLDQAFHQVSSVRHDFLIVEHPLLVPLDALKLREASEPYDVVRFVGGSCIRDRSAH
jgi:hypothetical protein